MSLQRSGFDTNYKIATNRQKRLNRVREKKRRNKAPDSYADIKQANRNKRQKISHSDDQSKSEEESWKDDDLENCFSTCEDFEASNQETSNVFTQFSNNDDSVVNGNKSSKHGQQISSIRRSLRIQHKSQSNQSQQETNESSTIGDDSQTSEEGVNDTNFCMSISGNGTVIVVATSGVVGNQVMVYRFVSGKDTGIQRACGVAQRLG
eukprot:scaffold197469_cov51-Cyclotella_meneghiniana.AAC.1